jgi:membrane protein involved in colicin uptake
MKQLKLFAVASLALFVSTSAMALRPPQTGARPRPAGSVIDAILNRDAAVDARHDDEDSRKGSKEQDKRERERAKELRKQEHERQKAMREDRREREKDRREAERERAKDARERDRDERPAFPTAFARAVTTLR